MPQQSFVVIVRAPSIGVKHICQSSTNTFMVCFNIFKITVGGLMTTISRSSIVRYVGFKFDSPTMKFLMPAENNSCGTTVS